MIQINLSEQQAKQLLYSIGWRFNNGALASCTIDEGVCSEIMQQLEQRLTPPPTEAAELAKWRYERGLVERDIEQWKRVNEVMD